MGPWLAAILAPRSSLKVELRNRECSSLQRTLTDVTAKPFIFAVSSMVLRVFVEYPEFFEI